MGAGCVSVLQPYITLYLTLYITLHIYIYREKERERERERESERERFWVRAGLLPVTTSTNAQIGSSYHILTAQSGSSYHASTCTLVNAN